MIGAEHLLEEVEVVQQRSGAFASLKRVLVVRDAQALQHRVRVARDLVQLSALADGSVKWALVSRLDVSGNGLVSTQANRHGECGTHRFADRRLVGQRGGGGRARINRQGGFNRQSGRSGVGVRGRAIVASLAALALPLAAGAAAGLSGAAEPVAVALPARPQRIMSTNQCSDLLLLMLVPRERIASITHLAHGPVEALIPGADEGVAINHGLAEEVVSQRPDLILASPWSTPVLRRLAARVGAPVVEIDSANSFADIRRITRQIGALVGEPARAEALIDGMDRTLAELAATRPARTMEVVAWSAGDAAPGEGTLTDEIIEAAGAVNLAARLPGAGFSSFGVEELLAARPDAILRGVGGNSGPSLKDSASEHPVVRRAFRGRRITYPVVLHSCGLPQSAAAAAELRGALAKVPVGGVRW